MQALGLVERYKDEDDFKQFVGKVDGLAFLPVNDVRLGLQHLRDELPNDDDGKFK